MIIFMTKYLNFVFVCTAAEGFVVYNSVPYGSIFDVLPYLSRRATENKAVLKGTRRERALLTQELRSRFLGFWSSAYW